MLSDLRSIFNLLFIYSLSQSCGVYILATFSVVKLTWSNVARLYRRQLVNERAMVEPRSSNPKSSLLFSTSRWIDQARLGKAPFCSGLYSLPAEHSFELIRSLIILPATIQVLMVSLSAFNEHFLWIDSLHCFVHLLNSFWSPVRVRCRYLFPRPLGWQLERTMEQLMWLKIQAWEVGRLKYEREAAPGSHVSQQAEIAVETNWNPGEQGQCHRHSFCTFGTQSSAGLLAPGE